MGKTQLSKLKYKGAGLKPLFFNHIIKLFDSIIDRSKKIIIQLILSES